MELGMVTLQEVLEKTGAARVVRWDAENREFDVLCVLDASRILLATEEATRITEKHGIPIITLYVTADVNVRCTTGGNKTLQLDSLPDVHFATNGMLLDGGVWGYDVFYPMPVAVYDASNTDEEGLYALLKQVHSSGGTQGMKCVAELCRELDVWGTSPVQCNTTFCTFEWFRDRLLLESV